MMLAAPNPKHEAPLNDTHPNLSRIPQTYRIFLRPGLCLRDQSDAVPFKVPPHIEHIVTKFTEQVVYVAKNIDDDLLAVIRADAAVEKLEYEYQPSVDVDAKHSETNKSYESPLTESNPESRRRRKTYQVMLRPGHTIQDHNAAIGMKIEPYTRYISGFKEWNTRIFYTAGNIEDRLLAAIRSDPGVENVEFDPILMVFDDESELRAALERKP
jgi:hypothetical protein